MDESEIAGSLENELLQLNLDLRQSIREGAHAKSHGTDLRQDDNATKGLIASIKNGLSDFSRIFAVKNAPTFFKIAGDLITLQGFKMQAAASLIGSMPNDSKLRRAILDGQVKAKYDKLLHPPLTYLGDAFQYRESDGKYNNVLSPHLGQAGTPYAKTVPSKTHQLGALPAPSDLFDRLIARQKGGRQSRSGLSSMLLYHATLIIHDIFRTNDYDRNISDTSSYLDLSPLYGYNMEMQRKIRDDKYKLGLLKPDTFAEDRLLRQPPGVCVMLVMYNRYHNYAAMQLRLINENGRFSVPKKYDGTMLACVARESYAKYDETLETICDEYGEALKSFMARQPRADLEEVKNIRENENFSKEDKARKIDEAIRKADKADFPKEHMELEKWTGALEEYISKGGMKQEDRRVFEARYCAAWEKLDDDLFNTARLITCGLYIQVAIYDYLRALMGFHQWNTNFTLDPRLDINDHRVSRGIGNQVTVEFNLLYRFHCAISANDESYIKSFMEKSMSIPNADEVTLEQFMKATKMRYPQIEPCEITFGIPGEPGLHFVRDPVTHLFDDQAMIDVLTKVMDDPISNFGPRNVPRCLKPVEILSIVQARKWRIGTLNDFRDFFGMPRHQTFESVTKNVDIQNALRDLYEHPDKIELYPGVFYESDASMGVDPGPGVVDSALWAAIFCDAVTLVRSDRFYTTDWNTNSLTAWGMKEVTPDDNIFKGSVFHRLIQRAFPKWYPYDAVQFFHPFYTRQTNARFAAEQGYAPDLKMSRKPAGSDKFGAPVFDIRDSIPQKPVKPLNIDQIEEIKAILESPNYVHPILKDPSSLPECFKRILESRADPVFSHPQEDIKATARYFTDLMREIIMRECISMGDVTLQIDATRDFAIPVVTRYVADFLGFSHLIRSTTAPSLALTENEIYHHIEDCHTFLSYNSDETKLFSRRRKFKNSMGFLHSLTLNGHLRDASRNPVSRFFLGKSRNNAMAKYGYEISEAVLKNENYDITAAAAIMVLVGLQAAYNAVLVFTSTLSYLLDELYVLAAEIIPGSPRKMSRKVATWRRVQELAFKNDQESNEELRQIVADTERKSMKVVLMRVARNANDHQKILLDVYKANNSLRSATPNAHSTSSELEDSTTLARYPTVSGQFSQYQPKYLAESGVTNMIKFFAQMKNLRRGHGAQGQLKKVKLDASTEGYSDYMAPMRTEWISKQSELLGDQQQVKRVGARRIMRPETDTYLTADWDEMVPFPNTWKLRFDGFGRSNYNCPTTGEKYGKLRDPTLDDSEPPIYQPRGPSHTGGTFSHVVCSHEIPVYQDQSQQEKFTTSSGCGLGRVY